MVLKLGRFVQQIRNTWKALNVVLEKDGEDHVRNEEVLASQGTEEYPT